MGGFVMEGEEDEEDDLKEDDPFQCINP